ncbi:MAG TPA: metal ABC transporter ATP-binding protein, partial [Erysipelothrix sp.]|nr:metal ABC transporter ATP-binding protein [Erysipelothrix sp.]
HKIVGIIGPNGAGKSTMIKAILNLIKKDAGEVIWDDELYHNRKVSYLPQRNDVDWNFPISVLEVVSMGLYPKVGVGKKLKKEDMLKAEEALNSVGMREYRDTQIGQLSGGQQQRVFMARALVQNPDVLFLDEPFVGIDTTTEKLLMMILQELKGQGKLIFIVHHDLSKVHDYFDDLMILNKDIVAMGDVKDVFNDANLGKAYLSQISQIGGSDA